MGNSSSTLSSTKSNIHELSPKQLIISPEKNIFLTNLIKLNETNNNSTIESIVEQSPIKNKKKIFNKFKKKSTTITTTKKNNKNDINETTYSGISINKLLPEYLIVKILKYACDIVFPSKSFSSIVSVCKLWARISIKSIRHLFYQFRYLYENDKDLNYCKIIGRWLSAKNHYGISNKIHAIYLKIMDPLGLFFLVPYLIKCNSLRLLRVEFTNGLGYIERVNTIIQVVALNQHIKVLNLSCNTINPKSISCIGEFLCSPKSNNLKEFIYRQSKLTSSKFASLLRYIVDANKISIINFSDNQIENEQLDIILDSLSNSKSLHTINLSRNYLSTSSMHLILQALISNKVTKSIDLRYNQFDQPSDRDSFIFEYSQKFKIFKI